MKRPMTQQEWRTRKVLYDIDLGILCDGAGPMGQGAPTRIKCTGQAIYTVAAHRIDHCEGQGNGLGLGKFQAFTCAQCTAAILQMYGQLLVNGPVTCQACEKTFTKLHDVIQVDHLIVGSKI